jgi:acetyl esterase/lipase
MIHPLLLRAVAGALLCAALATGAEPTPDPRPVRRESDLAFGMGGGRVLKLDLAMPARGDGPFPAVVCVHGGGWVGGDRTQMATTITVLARCGYVAVSPDYRLAPADRFPAALEDCKAAVRWLRANAARYRINPNRIGAVGFSSGAHLACLLGVTEKEDGLEGSGGNAGESSAVQAVVSFFGPTDLTHRFWTPVMETKNLLPLLGGTLEEKPDAYRRASPLAYIRRTSPPFLCIHGTRDRTVPAQQSQAFVERLQGAGAAARLLLVPDVGHGWSGEKLWQSLGQMLHFFNEKLQR